MAPLTRGKKVFLFVLTKCYLSSSLSLCKYSVIENTAMQTQNLMFSVKASILEL